MASHDGEAKREYGVRLEQSRQTATQWRRRERWLSNLRLFVFASGLGLCWLAFGLRELRGVWLFPIVLCFGALVVLHDRAIRRRSRAERQTALYERGLARLSDRWAGTGEPGERYRDPGHPYADDLDLFGRGSVFELLCTARTLAGERTLASWLRTPASADVVRDRQAAVDELRGRLDLREDLALLGQEVRSKLDPSAVIAWGEKPPLGVSTRVRVAAAAVSAASVASLTAWALGAASGGPFAAALLVQCVLAGVLKRRVRAALDGIDRPTRDLRLLAELLGRLERESPRCALLLSLRNRLDTDGLPPSRRTARLQLLVDLLDARRNQLFAPLGALLLWGTQLGLAIEAWRSRWGENLRHWIDAAGEVEALCALAGYAYEHPGDPFPEIVDAGPVFEARDMGHPLIPESRCVRNDLALGEDRSALIVSGSNMSGKSTFLRSAGCNAVLALAGAPVRAGSLRLSTLWVAASIRVNDSLQDGTSRFYAEILRLRQIVERAEGEARVLFLLDEILHGTNSHDRRVGAEAVVRGLVERGAVGLVTTHDLALAKIADELSPRVENVHFEDRLSEGRICFDYRLRPGIVRRSNALELMRAIGLDV